MENRKTIEELTKERIFNQLRKTGQEHIVEWLDAGKFEGVKLSQDKIDRLLAEADEVLERLERGSK